MNIKQLFFIFTVIINSFSLKAMPRTIQAAKTITTVHQKRIKRVIDRIKQVFIEGVTKDFTDYMDELLELLNDIPGYENLCKDIEGIKYEKRLWIILLHLRTYQYLMPQDLKDFLKKIPYHKKIAVFQEMIHFNKN